MEFLRAFVIPMSVAGMVGSGLLFGAACSDETAMLVTVRTRPSVTGATSLAVELKNGAGLAGDTLELRDRTFPVTFSISSPGRTGELEIRVSARDKDDLLVGRGTVLVPITAATAEVFVDSADFVVNTNFAEDQFLTDDYEAVGSQLAVTTQTREWLTTFRERCTAATCNVFARRHNVLGQPVVSTLAAGTNAFPLNTARVGVIASPAVAGGADRTLVFWETTDVNDNADGVACRSIDRMGAGLAVRQLVSEPSTDVVVATPLANGTFAVAWSGKAVVTDRSSLRTMLVNADCTISRAPQVVSTLLPTAGLRQSSIAAAADGYVMAWHADGGVRARFVSLDGTLAGTAETQLLTPVAGEQFQMVRLASFAGGYAMVVAHSSPPTVSLRLYRFTATSISPPTLIGTTTVVTDKLDTLFDGFSIASHPQGPMLVSWHGCGVRGDGEGCGVFGRLFSKDGIALGEPFVIPTTTAMDQRNPSAVPIVDESGAPLFVVAWNDRSGSAPDTSGSAVRARILYPTRQ